MSPGSWCLIQSIEISVHGSVGAARLLPPQESDSAGQKICGRECRFSGALIVISGLLSWASRGGIWLLRIWFACFSILTDRFLSYITIFLFPSHNASDDKHMHVSLCIDIRWKIGGSPLKVHSEDTVCYPVQASKTSLGLTSAPTSYWDR